MLFYELISGEHIMIAGYFERVLGKLQMPERPEGTRDELGIRWSGSVLCGKDSVEARQWDADYGARVRQADDRCDGLEDYDPVLRSACRLE